MITDKLSDWVWYLGDGVTGVKYSGEVTCTGSLTSGKLQFPYTCCYQGSC